MDDLPPPEKITLDSPDTSGPVEAIASKRQDTFKRVINFIVKIKWTKVAAYLIGFAGVLGLIISHPAVKDVVNHYFPNSSPVFARDVSMQGVLRSSSNGLYTLVLPDNQAYALHFKPATSLTGLKKLNEVVVKGNLGWESFVIENAEVYPLNFVTPDDSSTQIPQTSFTPRSLGGVEPNSPNIPDLFPGLKWETSQKRVLIFTSGKRKIEQEGIYLESGSISLFPQDFINYYIEGLNAAGFKETLNSISPEGVTITYAKDDSYLTFGIKNIYQGSGGKKTLSGYKAFIEHN